MNNFGHTALFPQDLEYWVRRFEPFLSFNMHWQVPSFHTEVIISLQHPQLWVLSCL